MGGVCPGDFCPRTKIRRLVTKVTSPTVPGWETKFSMQHKTLQGFEQA